MHVPWGTGGDQGALFRTCHQAVGKHLYMLSHFAGLRNEFSIFIIIENTVSYSEFLNVAF